MRKLFLTISIAFAALVLTQCRKAEVPQGGSDPGMFEMTLTAGQGGEKSDIDGLCIRWKKGDKLYVVDCNASDNGVLGHLTATADGTSTDGQHYVATFIGYITQPVVGHVCQFYYVGDNEFTINEGKYIYDVSVQHGSLDATGAMAQAFGYDNNGTGWGSKDGVGDIANTLQLMKGTSTATITQDMIDNHNFGSGTVYLQSMMSISRIDLQVNGTSLGSTDADVVTLTGTGCYATAQLNIATGALAPVQGTITLNRAGKDYYLVLIPNGGSALNLTFTAPGGQTASVAPAISANTFYYYSTTGGHAINMKTIVPPPPGAIDGLFSVADGKQVYFSRGNLYWDGSKWLFETKQYDFRTWEGEGCYISGTTATTTTPDDHCGIFLWSKNEADAYSENTYSTGSDDVLFTNDEENTPNTGFHVNGETGNNKWRTLSLKFDDAYNFTGEWFYLLNTRTGTYNDGTATASQLGGNGRIEVSTGVYVNGIILLPDTFTLPSGLSFQSYYAAGSEINYDNNTYSTTEWSSMEGAGAVFLPATGYRYGTSVSNVGSGGSYWSNTPSENYDSNQGYANRMYFDSDNVSASYDYRIYGRSVRLVRNVE